MLFSIIICELLLVFIIDGFKLQKLPPAICGFPFIWYNNITNISLEDGWISVNLGNII